MRGDTTRLENVRILMLKGEQGAQGERGESGYDDTEIQAKVAANTADISELDGDVSALQTSYRQISSDMATATAAIAAVQEQASVNADDIDDLESRFANASGDLNDLKKTGIYFCGTSMTNLPTSGRGGIVIVGSNNSQTNVWQVYVESGTNGLYLRRYGSSAWTSWSKTDFDAIYSRISTLEGRFSSFTGDLDDLKAGGTYYCNTSVTNLPTAHSGVAFVGASTAGTFVTQVYVALSVNGLYVRQFTNGAWTSWTTTMFNDISAWRNRFASYSGDLNSLKDGGAYYCASSATNTPDGTTGTVYVASADSNTYVTQLFIARAVNGLYIRKYISDAWTDWEKTDFDTIASDISALRSRFTSYTGTALNSLKTAGIYYVTNTVTNVPDNHAGIVYVGASASASYVTQMFIAKSVNGVYLRTFDGSWSNWVLLDFDAVNAYLTSSDTRITTLENRFVGYSGTNLNNLKTAGAYYVTNSVTNAPDGHTGTVYVAAAVSGVYVSQLFVAKSVAGVYMRRYEDGAWTDWTLISTDTSTATFDVSYGGASATLTVRKKNGYAECNLMIQGSVFSTATGNDLIGTIPSGYRPASTGYAAGIARDGNASGYITANYYPVEVIVGTGGNITIRGNAENLKTCRTIVAHLVWFLA